MLPKFEYPVARRDETIVDDFHGTKVAFVYFAYSMIANLTLCACICLTKQVADPYRWLEDPDSAETQAYVDANNAISKPFLDACAERTALQDKLTELWNYPKYTAPSRKGNHYYHYANTGLQNQSVLYKQSSLDGEATVFVDPNALSADGTIALASTSFSDDGEYFAYGLSQSGSDWSSIRVRRVCDGEDFPECLEKIKFSSITWTKDNKGFFYAVFF